MKDNYEELQVDLLRFARYKILDLTLAISDKKTMLKELQEIKDNQELNKKYITAIVVYDNKVIETINEKANKFDLKFLRKFKNNTDDLKIIIYLFDITDKKNHTAYNSFLKVNNPSIFTNQLKEDFQTIKHIAPIFGIVSAFVFLFVYLGLAEYGIPFGEVTDTASMVSMLISIFLIFIVILTFSYILVAYFVIPFFVCYLLDISEILHCSNYSIMIMIGIYLFGIYFILNRNFPLLVSKYNNIVKEFIRDNTFIVSIGISIVLIIIMLQAIISTFLPKNTFYSKSAYAFVGSGYHYYYSGYPKILKKNEKYYYVALKDARRYYAYDIQNIKERYFDLLRKDEQKNSICKNDTSKKEFIKGYILNNPYIKPKYHTQYFKIDDKNITIEEFNINKLIHLDEIKKLCNK